MSFDQRKESLVPNALLIGPPKCGTSSVYDWLARHPEVAGSQPKETFYLMDAGNPLIKGATWNERGDAGFVSFFSEAAKHCSVRLDATTHHMFQDAALQFARAHPGTRAISILREPASRLRSSFEFTRNNLSALRDGLTFREYVAMVRGGQRLTSDICFRAESAYVLERDLAYGEYARYLVRWREAVGERGLHVQTFDRLVRDPRGTMMDICRFLGIDPGFYENFPFERKNETIEIRSHATHRLARRFGRRLAGGTLKAALKKIYFHFQTAAGDAGKDEERGDADVLKSLREHYRQHNRLLQEEFRLDVSAWNA